MIKKMIVSILRSLGLKIVREKELFPSYFYEHKDISPITLSYLLNRNGVVINAEMKKGRGLPIYSFSCEENHPFSFAVNCVKDTPIHDQYNEIYKILSAYYERMKPSSAGEVAELPKRSILYNYPAWAIVMPWEANNIDDWEQHIIKSVAFENSNEKYKFGIESGWAWLGPVEDEKLIIESNRLANLLKSIQQYGYKRNDYNDGDVNADILIADNNKWVWQSVGGQHRASVLSGLGMNNVLIRVRKIIRRQDVMYWPNVINGTYSVSEALKVFDKIHKGNNPNISSEWNKYVSKRRMSDE
jgi:hypothetical protein